MAADLYRCPDCGWVGTESEMEADYAGADDISDEAWSNWICPKCGLWHRLEDYEDAGEATPGPPA